MSRDRLDISSLHKFDSSMIRPVASSWQALETTLCLAALFKGRSQTDFDVVPECATISDMLRFLHRLLKLDETS